MKQTIQKFTRNETFLSVLLILLTAIITYGLSIPRLGYYHDDWYLLWSGQARGAASIISLFSTDRPFMGVVYSYVYRLLGDSLLGWHLYALLWRLVGGLAFFWILRLLWPGQKYLTTLMTVLFLVYPGFLSQPNANTKQNHLYGFGTALLSIALTLEAMRTGRRGWKILFTLLSLALTANYLWIYEYMIGFEGTRLVLIGYALYRNGVRGTRKIIKEILKIAWPYLLVTAGFLYWRIFLFEGSRNATDAGRLAGNYLSDLRYMSIRLVMESFKDLLDTTLFAWFAMPYQLISSALYSGLGIAILIAGLVIALVLLYRKHGDVNQEVTDTPNLIRDLIVVGALVTLCAVVPVILSGRHVELYDAYKSYGLHPIPGVLLLVTGILLMFQPRFRWWIVVALIGISVTAQVLNADNWASYWTYQRQMWWQLTWRAPDLQDDTLVMTYSDTGFNPEQDYEIWGPLNLIYRPGPAKAPPIQAEVLNSDTAYNILKREVKNNKVRDIRMHRDFNNLLLLSMSPASSCLHVIDGTLPVYSENEALLLKQVGAYSRIDRIVPTGTAPVPSTALFGPEPARGWCYFYQKASLARQTGNWEEISRLYDQVRESGLETDDKSELIPFLEGLVNVGRLEEARALFQSEIKGNAKMRLPLCTSLEQDPGYPPAFGYDYGTVNEILCEE